MPHLFARFSLPAVFVLAMLAIRATPATAQPRMWTDSTGKHTVEAELVEVNKGKAVLKKPGGKNIAVPLERLSEADRKFLAALEKPARQTAAQPVQADWETIVALKHMGGWCKTDKKRQGQPVVEVTFNRGRGSDAGLASLQTLTELESLSLRGGKVTDAGLVHLAGLTRLRTLQLDSTGVSSAAIGRLRAALPNTDISWSPTMPTMQQLTAGHQAEQAAIAKLKSLGAAVEEPPAGRHPRAVRAIRCRDEQGTDAGLKPLKDLGHLHSLFLDSARVTDTDLEPIGKLEKLHLLDLNGCRITNAGLKHLEDLKGLTFLSLQGTPISDAGLAHLQAFPMLQTLNLNGTRITDAGLKQLGGLKKLMFLHLSNTDVSDVGMEHLENFPSLLSLFLINTRVTDTGLETLRAARHPQNVYLISKPTSADDMTWRKQLAELSILAFAHSENPAEKEFVKSLLLRAHSLEPDNAEWTAMLGWWYVHERLLLRGPENREPFVEKSLAALKYFEQTLQTAKREDRKQHALLKVTRLSFDAGQFEKAQRVAK